MRKARPKAGPFYSLRQLHRIRDTCGGYPTNSLTVRSA
jgi:hypothetical protein